MTFIEDSVYEGLDRVSKAAISSGERYTASLISDKDPSDLTATRQEPTASQTLIGQERKSTISPDSNLRTKSDMTNTSIFIITNFLDGVKWGRLNEAIILMNK